MTPERYRQIGKIFDETLELPSEKRAAHLKQVCVEDPALLGEVEKLLANHSDSQTFLSRPAAQIAAEMLAQNHVPLSTGKQIGHYKILSPLGAGGMGEVYLAEDIRLKRKVALKVLPAMVAQDKERLRRFEQEALASSALNHPNILTIYDFAAEGETQFLATEFIDGETVHSRLKREPLSITAAVDIAAQCAQALATAH
jgi:serine/threonine protein kinase